MLDGKNIEQKKYKLRNSLDVPGGAQVGVEDRGSG